MCVCSTSSCQVVFAFAIAVIGSSSSLLQSLLSMSSTCSLCSPNGLNAPPAVVHVFEPTLTHVCLSGLACACYCLIPPTCARPPPASFTSHLFSLTHLCSLVVVCTRWAYNGFRHTTPFVGGSRQDLLHARVNGLVTSSPLPSLLGAVYDECSVNNTFVVVCVCSRRRSPVLMCH